MHFHSIPAVEIDTLPWGYKCKHATAERIQSATKNLFVLWEKPYILKIVCVIGLPSLYATGIVSYITSRHVLGDIIQPAWDGAALMITGTGVFFISLPKHTEPGYFTSPFNSSRLFSHSPPMAHKEDTVLV